MVSTGRDGRVRGHDTALAPVCCFSRRARLPALAIEQGVKRVGESFPRSGRMEAAFEAFVTAAKTERPRAPVEDVETAIRPAFTEWRGFHEREFNRYTITERNHLCWMGDGIVPLSHPAHRFYGCTVCKRTHLCRIARESCPLVETQLDDGGHYVCGFSATEIERADKEIGIYEAVIEARSAGRVDNRADDPYRVVSTRAKMETTSRDHEQRANFFAGDAKRRKKEHKLTDNAHAMENTSNILSNYHASALVSERRAEEQCVESTAAPAGPAPPGPSRKRKRHGGTEGGEWEDASVTSRPTPPLIGGTDVLRIDTLYDSVDRARDDGFGDAYFAALDSGLRALAQGAWPRVAATAPLALPEQLASTPPPPPPPLPPIVPFYREDTACRPTSVSKNADLALRNHVRGMCTLMDRVLAVQWEAEGGARPRPNVRAYATLMENMLCLCWTHLWEVQYRAELCRFVVGALTGAFQQPLTVADVLGHRVTLFAPDPWLLECRRYGVAEALFDYYSGAPPKKKKAKSKAKAKKNASSKLATMSPYHAQRRQAEEEEDEDDEDEGPVSVALRAHGASPPAPILVSVLREGAPHYGQTIRQAMTTLPFNATTIHAVLHLDTRARAALVFEKAPAAVGHSLGRRH